MKYVLLLIAATLAATVQAKVIVNIEAPQQGGISSGVSNIRGWAVADSEIIATKYFIDGIDHGEIPFGSRRGDVAEKYADQYFDAVHSGFSATQYWGHLDDDVPHTITVQILTETGEFAEATNDFEVVRFQQGLEWKKVPNLFFSDYTLGKTDDTFYLGNFLLQGVLYKQVEFKWNNETQGFTITGIN